MIVLEKTLLAAQATNGTAEAVQTNGRAKRHKVYVEWSAGVTAGEVVVEAAPNTDYSGTWAPIATVTFSGTGPKIDTVDWEGAEMAIQTRISTAVANGTVTTRYIGAN